MKKERKRLDNGTEARRVARAKAAVPGATKVVVDKRRKPEKHKRLVLEEQ
jgi:ribosomal protein L44E